MINNKNVEANWADKSRINCFKILIILKDKKINSKKILNT